MPKHDNNHSNLIGGLRSQAEKNYHHLMQMKRLYEHEDEENLCQVGHTSALDQLFSLHGLLPD